MKKLFLVCSESSSRLQYVIQLWNTQVLAPQLVFSESPPEDAPFILYEASPSSSFSIPNTGFLFSRSADFPLARVDFSLDFPNFDFFSYVFALATECYHYRFDFPRDKWGRYCEKESPVLRNDLHHKPFFPFWASKICQFLDVPIQFYPPEPLWIMLDIDNPFHFKYRGWFRQVKSLMKDLATLNFEQIILKFQLLFGGREDPFEASHWQRYIEHYHYLVFFLMEAGAGNSNTSPYNPHYHRQILSVPVPSIGVHFSLKAKEGALGAMKKEKELLEKVTRSKITKSRQHYLWYNMPETFQGLLQLGIEQDYTTCFYSVRGYKHGLVRPFLWYDLGTERLTPLVRFPAFFMDRHALNAGHTFEQALEYVEEQISVVQFYGGIPMILLHNETFSQMREWKAFDWGQYFQKQKATRKE